MLPRAFQITNQTGAEPSSLVPSDLLPTTTGGTERKSAFNSTGSMKGALLFFVHAFAS
jgi:hypothetical protein